VVSPFADSPLSDEVLVLFEYRERIGGFFNPGERCFKKLAPAKFVWVGLAEIHFSRWWFFQSERTLFTGKVKLLLDRRGGEDADFAKVVEGTLNSDTGSNSNFTTPPSRRKTD